MAVMLSANQLFQLFNLNSVTEFLILFYFGGEFLRMYSYYISCPVSSLVQEVYRYHSLHFLSLTYTHKRSTCYLYKYCLLFLAVCYCLSEGSFSYFNKRILLYCLLICLKIPARGSTKVCRTWLLISNALMSVLSMPVYNYVRTWLQVIHRIRFDIAHKIVEPHIYAHLFILSKPPT